MCAEHPLATIFKKHIEVKCLIVAFSAMVESEEHLYMRITDKDNMNKELQYRKIYFDTVENDTNSDRLERKIKAYKMKFSDKYARRYFIDFGDLYGVVK